MNHQAEAVEVKKIIDHLATLEAEGGTVTQEDLKFLE
jgi:hypothetical protein